MVFSRNTGELLYKIWWWDTINGICHSILLGAQLLTVIELFFTFGYILLQAQHTSERDHSGTWQQDDYLHRDQEESWRSYEKTQERRVSLCRYLPNVLSGLLRGTVDWKVPGSFPRESTVLESVIKVLFLLLLSRKIAAIPIPLNE